MSKFVKLYWCKVTKNPRHKQIQQYEYQINKQYFQEQNFIKSLVRLPCGREQLRKWWRPFARLLADKNERIESQNQGKDRKSCEY